MSYLVYSSKYLSTVVFCCCVGTGNRREHGMMEMTASSSCIASTICQPRQSLYRTNNLQQKRNIISYTREDHPLSARIQIVFRFRLLEGSLIGSFYSPGHTITQGSIGSRTIERSNFLGNHQSQANPHVCTVAQPVNKEEHFYNRLIVWTNIFTIIPAFMNLLMIVNVINMICNFGEKLYSVIFNLLDLETIFYKI